MNKVDDCANSNWLSGRHKAGLISGYAISHGWVDAVSIYLVLGLLDVKTQLAWYIILYNVLAFGLQLPFGFISDRCKAPKCIALIGIFLIIGSVFLAVKPLFAIMLVSFGNALFHVGGGSVALNIQPGKAFFPGLFVAPGGLGLFIGSFLAFNTQVPLYLILVSGLVLIGWLLFLRAPVIDYKVVKISPASLIEPGLWLMLLVIVIRSVIGLSYSFTWKDTFFMGTLLVLSIAMGKGLGGLIADKFGWKRIVVWALILSSVLIFWGKVNLLSGLLAVLLLNISMPVTLTAVANYFKGRPGLAFGLTTMALLIGALPTFFDGSVWFNNEYIAFALVLLASGLFAFAFKRLSFHQLP